MKTNQIITRKMGELPVEQRTKDGMFNATMLAQAFNEMNKTNKEVKHYFENKATEEYIATIMEREAKGRNSVYLKTRGKFGGTWMHPMLFLDFAMWLNPSFKYDVLKFVQDQLIAFRNEAGDAYKLLSTAVANLSERKDVQKNVQTIARAINFVTYNQHEHELRNKVGDETKMKELMELERHVAQLCEEGFIKDYNSLLNYLRNLWRKRWGINPIDKLVKEVKQ